MHKWYLFLLCCTILCTSCGKKYKIEGVSSVSSLDGKMLFIKVPSGDKLISIDSAEVIHGLFKMEGKVDSTVVASLFMDDKCIMPVVIEKGNIDININNAGFTLKGTPLNDSFNEFILKRNSLSDRADEVEHLEARMILDGKDPAEVHREIEKQRNQVATQIDSLAKTFIQTNYDNVLGPEIFIILCYGMPYPVLTPVMQDIINEAPASFKENPMIKEFISIAKSNMDN